MAGVTPNGIHYPDGASKAKNLGPELEQMALDIDYYIGSYLRPDGPIRQIVIDIAEDVVPGMVDDYIAETNVVRAWPESFVERSGRLSVPLRWTDKILSDPYSDTYADEYVGALTGNAQRQGDVPLLHSSGKIRDVQIPDWVASKSDIVLPDPPEQVSQVLRYVRPGFSVFAGRLAQAMANGAPCAVVFAGSSSTARIGYVEPLLRSLQELWPVQNRSLLQRSQSADFTLRTQVGVHGYNAGEGATRSTTYLTDEESDKIAALNPAVIFHVIGASNDYTGQHDPAVVTQNMRNRLAYFDSVLTHPCQHIVVSQYARKGYTPPTYPHSAYVQAVADAADGRPDTVALDFSAIFSDLAVPGSDPLGLVAADDVHPSKAGYRLIAQHLAAQIVT